MFSDLLDVNISDDISQAIWDSCLTNKSVLCPHDATSKDKKKPDVGLSYT